MFFNEYKVIFEGGEITGIKTEKKAAKIYSSLIKLGRKKVRIKIDQIKAEV
jgi:hypothetical protein